MPMTVNGPGGITVNFPDGTDHATIDRVMREAVAKQTQDQPSMVGDIESSFRRGLFKGTAAIAGATGDIAQLAQTGAEAVGFPTIGKVVKTVIGRGQPTTQQITEDVEKITGKFGKAETTPGKYAESVGEFLPSAALGGEGLVARGVAAAAGGLGAEVGRELTGSELGGFIGGFAGGLSPKAIAKVITPNFINAERQAANAYLASEGVTSLTAGRKLGSKSVSYAESHLGDAPFAGGKATAAFEESGRQYTKAVLRRTGINADLATPDVLQQGFDDLGTTFDTLSARNTGRMDTMFIRKLDAALDEYQTNVQEGARRSAPNKFVQDFLDRLVVSPDLSGEQYKTFRSEYARQQRGAANDPEYSRFLGQVIDALDDVMQRSMTNPADAQAFAAARRQYRNLITVSKAVIGGSEQTKMGIITPAKLRQALTSDARGKRAYATGQGDFSQLAHAGEIAMTPLPQSGTAPRALAQSVASGLGAAVGGLLGGPATGAAGAVIGPVVGPAAAGRVLMSTPIQTYLANQKALGAAQAFPGAGASALRSALATSADSPLSITIPRRAEPTQ